MTDSPVSRRGAPACGCEDCACSGTCPSQHSLPRPPTFAASHTAHDCSVCSRWALSAKPSAEQLGAEACAPHNAKPHGFFSAHPDSRRRTGCSQCSRRASWVQPAQHAVEHVHEAVGCQLIVAHGQAFDDAVACKPMHEGVGPSVTDTCVHQIRHLLHTAALFNPFLEHAGGYGTGPSTEMPLAPPPQCSTPVAEALVPRHWTRHCS